MGGRELEGGNEERRRRIRGKGSQGESQRVVLFCFNLDKMKIKGTFKIFDECSILTISLLYLL